MARRKRHGGPFKARVAIEAIAGHMTVNEIATKYEIHPTLVTRWKKEALERLPEALSDGRTRKDCQRSDLEASLYQQIGQLTVELDYLKKKLDLCQ